MILIIAILELYETYQGEDISGLTNGRCIDVIKLEFLDRFERNNEEQFSHDLSFEGILKDPQSSQQFSALFLNFKEKNIDEIRNLDNGDNLWVCFAPLCTSHNFPPYKHFLERFSQFTNMSTIAIDIRGLEETSRLSIAQSLDLVRGKGFDKVLEPIFSALHSMNARNVNLYGYSMGGRLAGASIIPAKGQDISIEKMVLVEPAGVNKLEHIFGVLSLLNEARFLDFYNKYIFDPKQRSAMKLDLPLYKRLPYLLGEYLKPFNYRFEHLALFAASLQEATLKRELIQSLSHSRGISINILNGDKSKIAQSPDISTLLESIEGIGVANQHKIRWIKLEGDTHIVGLDTERLISSFRYLI